MAEEESTGEESKSGGGKKKLIIIIVLVLVLVGGGVGAFLALGGSKEDAEEGEELEEEGEETGEAILPAAVLPLETFIVNLQVKGSFLKVTLQLEFAEPELPPTVESEIPKLRDTIIRILSSKESAEILTQQGKETLREELRNGVNETLGAEDVTQVYFTEFIIQ
ncbi:MAG: flagellar basal body-associated FliL family protein [Bdellovibrionales bacterium]|nr:flagellar basal body-associated FliL family protein [Bdellovibrionales bacterium]